MDKLSARDRILMAIMRTFASPAFAWLAVSMCCFLAGITGRIDFTMISLSLMILAHVICYLVEQSMELEHTTLNMRATTHMEPSKCKICNENPDVVYFNDADTFYVRCNTCSLQTQMEFTAGEAIKDWNLMNEGAHQEESPE